ncbi:MAG: recombinase RecA [Archaeoglobus sp.]|nr:recombinase RecA [Archaeoglobus sp.]
MGWTIRDVLGDESEKKEVKTLKTAKTVKKTSFSDETEVERLPSLLRDENLPTGIDLLDKNLDGGFPKGSLVCVYADPAASPETFLYQFSTERKTYYLNATRPVFAIKKDFSSLNLDDTLVNFIDVYSFYFKELHNDPDEVDLKTINFALDEIQTLNEEEINLVIDNLNFFFDLKVESRLKEMFLNTLYTLPKENSGLAFIYVVKDSLDAKTIKRIFDLSDVIMEIFIEISGSRYVKRFGIPKIRGRTPLSDLFKFDVGEGVHLDTSRDIA